MITIRPADPGDVNALAELRWEFRGGDEAPHPEDRRVEGHDEFTARCAAWMRTELGGRDAWRAWVAVSDGTIVGQVWLQLIHKVPNPAGEREKHAYLSNLYVRPSARGGVGRRLLEAAIAAAESSGVDRIVLWPSPRSRTLYLGYGFTPIGEVMERTCP